MVRSRKEIFKISKPLSSTLGHDKRLTLPANFHHENWKSFIAFFKPGSSRKGHFWYCLNNVPEGRLYSRKQSNKYGRKTFLWFIASHFFVTWISCFDLAFSFSNPPRERVLPRFSSLSISLWKVILKTIRLVTVSGVTTIYGNDRTLTRPQELGKKVERIWGFNCVHFIFSRYVRHSSQLLRRESLRKSVPSSLSSFSSTSATIYLSAISRFSVYNTCSSLSYVHV